MLGGVEASMRRIAHYDFWSDSIRRSILFDARADALIYGMARRILFRRRPRVARGGAESLRRYDSGEGCGRHRSALAGPLLSHFVRALGRSRDAHAQRHQHRAVGYSRQGVRACPFIGCWAARPSRSCRYTTP